MLGVEVPDPEPPEQAQVVEAVYQHAPRIFSRLDLGEAVQAVTDAARDITGGSFAGFFYTLEGEGEDGAALKLYAISGATPDRFGPGHRRDTRLFEPTVVGLQTVRCDDIAADPRFSGMPPGHLPVRSYLAVPVTMRGGVPFGAILVGDPEPGRFTASHERIVQGLAMRASLAIDNARLYREAQRELEQRRAAEEELRRSNERLEERVAREVEARERAQEELRHAERLDALGKLVAGVGHDVNNSAMVILSAYRLLQRRHAQELEALEGNPGARRYLEAIKGAAERAGNTANRLLAFARRQPLKPVPICPADYMEEVANGVLPSSLGGAGVRLVLSPVSGSLPDFLADRAQLSTVLINLAMNARDAMAGTKAGTVALSAQFERVARGQYPGLQPGDFIRLEVADNGSGMARAVLERACEPFFTTKPAGDGTGLGLSMAHGFAEQSGGRLRLESAPGQGTVVSLWLPVAPRPAATADPPAAVSGPEPSPAGL